MMGACIEARGRRDDRKKTSAQGQGGGRWTHQAMHGLLVSECLAHKLVPASPTCRSGTACMDADADLKSARAYFQGCDAVLVQLPQHVRS
jgi:hypothetical protein